MTKNESNGSIRQEADKRIAGRIQKTNRLRRGMLAGALGLGVALGFSHELENDTAKTVATIGSVATILAGTVAGAADGRRMKRCVNEAIEDYAEARTGNRYVEGPFISIESVNPNGTKTVSTAFSPQIQSAKTSANYFPVINAAAFPFAVGSSALPTVAFTDGLNFDAYPNTGVIVGGASVILLAGAALSKFQTSSIKDGAHILLDTIDRSVARTDRAQS